jgi:hypothetical protein
MTTDTPRTDKAIEAMGLEAYVVPVEVCRQIELELAVSTENQLKAEAEITRLKALPHYHHESYCRKCGLAEMTDTTECNVRYS